LTKLSPAILSVVCPPPGATPEEYPDRLFNYGRDLCYLQLVFALARNPDWHPHLSEDRHIDRCINLIAKYCKFESFSNHAFYIAGILLRIAPEQKSITSLDSVTKEQWWDVTRSAWNDVPYDIHNTRDSESLLVLVDSTKKYMQIASKSDLERLIGKVDWFLEALELEMQMKRRWQEMGLETQLEMQGLEQERITVSVKELRTAASNMLESFGQPL
jgi:hypothetical protein